MKERSEYEKQGETLMLELKHHTKLLARTIPKVPDQKALFLAQHLANAIATMMFDLASSEPEYFFVVWPFLERDIKEAQAAVSLLQFRLRQPMVRRVIDGALHN